MSFEYTLPDGSIEIASTDPFPGARFDPLTGMWIKQGD